MNRKMMSVVLTAAMLSGAFTTGCTAAYAEEKTQITFLNGFTGGDGEFMRKITDGFNASQDPYEIIETQDADHLTSFKANGADLVVMQGSVLYTYKEDGMIREVSDIYEKAGLSTDDFIDAAVNIVTLDDGVYAFPLDIHPLTMFYNKELVAEAPETYDDILALNDQLQAENPDLYAMTIPGAGLSEWYYMMLVAQNSVELDEDGACNFATEEFADVMMKLHDMIFVDHVSPENMGLDSEFMSLVKNSDDITTQAAIALTGPWYYSSAKEILGDNLGIAAVPVIGNEAGTYGGAHNIAVSADVEDEAVIDGIAAFFAYMYTPENLLNWADAGQTPVHKATMEIVKADPETYPIPAVNAEQVVNAKLLPAVYNVSEQVSYINSTVIGRIVSEPDLTREDLMAELEAASDIARQIADEQ